MQSGYIFSSYVSPSPSSFIFAFLFLLITVFFLLFLICYFQFLSPSFSVYPCLSNLDCRPNQVCQNHNCVELFCTTNSDCPSGICLNSYCQNYSCNITNDCPSNTTCLDKFCVPINSFCHDNNDCHNTSCTNHVCSQCQSHSNCPLGQGCFNNLCRYPNPSDISMLDSYIYYSSPAKSHGNITAPPAYICPCSPPSMSSPNNAQLSSDVAPLASDFAPDVAQPAPDFAPDVAPLALNHGQSSNTSSVSQKINTPLISSVPPQPVSCDSNTTCPNFFPFCVNNKCRCVKGEVYENCQINTDCLSGHCMITKIGKICTPSGGECAFNYDNSDSECPGCCNSHQPYCVNGICSDSTLGSFCGFSENICQNLETKNALFCVNGICQNQPGNFNDFCTTTDSCLYPLVCRSINENEKRCLNNF